jgi:putative sigma-54 modulation protein
MKINLKGSGMELTPAIAEYAEKKVSMLSKFVPEDVVAHVEVGKSTQHHKHGDVFRAEIRLSGHGLDLYAVAEEPDLYAAIDLVKDEAIRSLTHEKGRREALYRRGARAVKEMMKGFNPFKKRP